MAGKAIRSRVGTFSSNTSIRKADRRSSEARAVSTVAADLVRQLGGRPSPAQRLLIEAASILALRLRCTTDRYLAGGELPEDLDARTLALVAGLRKTLATLGLETVKAPALSLAAYLEGKVAS